MIQKKKQETPYSAKAKNNSWQVLASRLRNWRTQDCKEVNWMKDLNQ